MKIWRLQGQWFSKKLSCDICKEAPWELWFDECSWRRLCHKCDATMHNEVLYHDREAWIDGCFRHIPPTVTKPWEIYPRQKEGLVAFSLHFVYLFTTIY